MLPALLPSRERGFFISENVLIFIHAASSFMKTYVINLPRCQERREHILLECDRFALEPEIYPGIDGNDLSEAELRRSVFEPDRNHLTPPEIGCALSHLGIYRDMVEKDIPHALILEDDVVFRIDPRPLLADFEHSRTDAPDVYLLTHGNNEYIDSERRQIGDMRFYRGWNATGAYGYIITKSGASNLIRFQTPLKCECDWWKFFQINKAIRFYIPEIEIIGVHPTLGSIPVSLLEEARRAISPSMKSRYMRLIRKQVPVWLRVKYTLYKFRNAQAIRRQETCQNLQ
jgi:glycosyl transferase family 25